MINLFEHSGDPLNHPTPSATLENADDDTENYESPLESDDSQRDILLSSANFMSSANLDIYSTTSINFQAYDNNDIGSDTLEAHEKSDGIDNDISEAYAVPPGEFPFQPDIKLGVHELCPVCGDKVSGYHYGLLTCESCKGFFKRTVQNKKVYSCVDNRTCHIDKSQRKRCPYCRFQKCLMVGMKLEAVREDRMRGGRNKFGPMYKRDRALKQQALRQHQHRIASCHMHGVPTSPDDIKPDPSLLILDPSYGYPGPSHFHKNLDPLNRDLYTLNGVMKEAFALDAALNGSNKDMTGINMSLSKITQQQQQQKNGSRHLLDKLPPYPFTHSMPYNSNDMSNSREYYQHVDGNRHVDMNSNVCGGVDRNHGNARNNGDTRNHGDIRDLSHRSVDMNRNLVVDSQRSAANVHDYSGNVSSYMNRGQPPNSTRSMGDINGNTASHDANSPDRKMEYYLPEKLHIGYDGSFSYVPKLIQQMQVTMLDDVQVRNKLMTFIQSDIDELDSHQRPHKFLHIMCQLADQCLFLMVEWARSSVFFKNLRVECQMTLLHHCWCELLILDFVHRQLQHTRPNHFLLASGHMISASYLDSLGISDIKEQLQDLTAHLRDLDLDFNEYACLKFVILLNPDRATPESRLFVEQHQEQINASLLEYCMTFHPNMSDKFSQLLHRLPEIRMLSIRIEEFLYFKHLNHEIPDQTLLMEMLHSKHK